MKKEHVFGYHSVLALLQHSPRIVKLIYLQAGKHDANSHDVISLAKQYHINVRVLPLQQLNQMTEDANHQGFIAEITPSKQYSESDLMNLLEKSQGPALLLVLDGVQDPHNLGACLRVANAVGAQAVIAPKDNAVGITPTVRKVACGAAETTPFIPVTNLVRTLRALKEAGIWICGADEDATQSIYEADFKMPLAMVLGAEDKGLRRLTRENCDFLVNIPMLGAVPSLNVSVAAGVCLFEAVRQRHKAAAKDVRK